MTGRKNRETQTWAHYRSVRGDWIRKPMGTSEPPQVDHTGKLPTNTVTCTCGHTAKHHDRRVEYNHDPQRRRRYLGQCTPTDTDCPCTWFVRKTR